jgi:hypothetical protein
MSLSSGNRITKFPDLSRIAAASLPLAVVLFVVAQRVWPVESNKTRSELLVKIVSKADWWRVDCCGWQSTHMCTWGCCTIFQHELKVEFFWEKKPRAKTPLSDEHFDGARVALQGLDCHHRHNQTMNRNTKTGR